LLTALPQLKEHPRMKLHHPLIALLCLGACPQVFAADPPAALPAAATLSEAEQKPADAAPAAATPSAAAAADAQKAKSGPSDADIKRLHAQGYRPVVHNGVTVYCRKEAQIGTRFESETCGSAEDIQKLADASKEATSHVQQTNTTPPHGR
jgi:hypothetical protein